MQFNDDGSEVTGKAEVGSTVTVYAADGTTVLGFDVADANGDYTVTLNPALVDGEGVKVTATDAADNESDPSEAVAPDLYAPAEPTATVDPITGATVTGVAEAGSTVTVYAADGTTVLGSIVAGSNGAYTVTLNPALVDGEEVKVTATDAGGKSSAKVATAPDLYAPAEPTATVDPITGAAVTGKAEAGSTVTVYAADGTTVLGFDVADANGDYTVTLSPALVDGEEVKVTAKDAGGESSAQVAIAPDTTPPELKILGAEDNVGGSQGNLYSGATTDDANPTLHGTVGEGVSSVTVTHGGITKVVDVVDGKWSYTPSTALPSGKNTITVTAKDAVQNTTVKTFDGLCCTNLEPVPYFV